MDPPPKWHLEDSPRVRTPVHGVDLGEVTPQGASRPHLNPPDWIQTSGYLSCGTKLN